MDFVRVSRVRVPVFSRAAASSANARNLSRISEISTFRPTCLARIGRASLQGAHRELARRSAQGNARESSPHTEHTLLPGGVMNWQSRQSTASLSGIKAERPLSSKFSFMTRLLPEIFSSLGTRYSLCRAQPPKARPPEARERVPALPSPGYRDLFSSRIRSYLI